MSFEVSWRKVRGELPGWCAGDAGMVPLSARETAKGEEQATQLAALRQVLPVLQRSHPRAKRKPAPRIMHSCPEAHRWEILGAKKDALAEAYCSACANPRLAVLFYICYTFLNDTCEDRTEILCGTGGERGECKDGRTEGAYFSDWIYGMWKEYECGASGGDDRGGAGGDGSGDRERGTDGDRGDL